MTLVLASLRLKQIFNRHYESFDNFLSILLYFNINYYYLLHIDNNLVFGSLRIDVNYRSRLYGL